MPAFVCILPGTEHGKLKCIGASFREKEGSAAFLALALRLQYSIRIVGFHRPGFEIRCRGVCLRLAKLAREYELQLNEVLKCPMIGIGKLPAVLPRQPPEFKP